MFNVLSQIVRGIWAIEPSVAESYLPQIMLVLNGKAAFDNPDPKRLMAGLINPEEADTKIKPWHISWQDHFRNAEPGSIALIPISGPIMKEDNCGSAGTSTRMAQIKMAASNQNIDAIVLQIDSPGGEVNGTQQLADVIKSVKKPVISFVDGMMASAALWIGSAGNEIISSTPQDIIGSIGTMISFADMRATFEAQGVKFHEVYADKSSDKNGIFKSALNGDYKPLKEELLNPLNEAFIKAVKTNRKGKFDVEKENIFTGKTYMAKDAIAHGLVDSIGTLDMAIARARELAAGPKANTKTNTNATTEPMKIKSTFTNIIASLKAKFNVEATEETVMTEEYAEHLNSELGRLTGELETKTSALTQASSDLSTEKNFLIEAKNALAAAQTAHEKEIEKLNAQITELKNEPGADTTTAGKTSDKIDDGKSFLDPNAAHNKYADSLNITKK